MDEDTRLTGQLKALGKKMFQFRDLVAKIEIPETVPPSPHDEIFWDSFVKKCSSAVSILKQVQLALSPDMYHLSVYPGEKIWRNPAAVPDLLSMPVEEDIGVLHPIATSREEVTRWNSVLEEANFALETYLNNSVSTQAAWKQPTSVKQASEQIDDRITSLLTMTSQERVERARANQ